MKDLKKRKNSIRHCYNRSVSTYDQYSYPQQMTGSRLVELVCKHISDTDSILDLGCGTGVITEKLILKLKNKLAFALDISDALLKKAKIRLAHYNIHFYNTDFDYITIENPTFNLVFSNMALHWSVHFQHCLQRIYRALKKNGLIAFTIPLHGTFMELASFSKNAFLKKEEVSDVIKQAGFLSLECIHDTLVFHFNSMMDAMCSIKATGSNGLFIRENKGLSSSTFCKKKYSQTMLKKPVTLTYEIGYFLGRKIRS